MQVNRTSTAQNYKKQPNFKGLATVGEKIAQQGSLIGKFAKGAEYNGVSMGLPSLLGLLYGATIVPRFVQATDKHERREVLTRDLLSITAILFLEKSLSKGFSIYNAAKSGFALNLKAKASEGRTGIKKFFNDINPLKGVSILSTKELVAKYSNLEGNKNGIGDFVDFIKNQGGDLKKVFSYDGKVKGHVEKIIGKSIKEASGEEIELGLKNAKKSNPALKAIYTEFKSTNNKFVKQAKLMNSTFAFISMCLLVPGFMIWIQRFNEKMTKKAVAKELAAKSITAESQKPQSGVNQSLKTAYNSSSESQKQVYADFLNKK